MNTKEIENVGWMLNVSIWKVGRKFIDYYEIEHKSFLENTIKLC